MSFVEAFFSLTMLAQTIRMTVPYACAALGGVFSERSGVINIALEGTLLVGGFASVAVHVATGSALLGLLGALVFGALFAFVHALLVVTARIDAIVSGVALNLVAAGGTRMLLRALYDSSSNSPTVAAFELGLFHGARGVDLLLRTLVDPITILTIVLTVAAMFGLDRTRFGLHVRASGEDPVSAASVGIDVDRTRHWAVVLGGAMAGLGGAALAFDQHQFQSGMSGGRGFIALAAVIVSGWRPGPAVLACVAFAALDALALVLQGKTALPPDAITMLPYVATLLTLALVSHGPGKGMRRFGPPAGLGKHPSS